MIGYLEGKVFRVFSSYLILLTNGVGYKVFVSSRELGELKEGNSVGFYITSIIKEDSFDLYGFSSNKEKNLFDMILGVSGIGPKTSLAVLSRFTQNEIIEAVNNSNVAFFSGIPRLGKKNASKLIIELKSKIGDKSGLDFQENIEQRDLIDALKSLGFTEKEIIPVLPLIGKKEGSITEKISYALKHFGNSNK